MRCSNYFWALQSNIYTSNFLSTLLTTQAHSVYTTALCEHLHVNGVKITQANTVILSYVKIVPFMWYNAAPEVSVLANYQVLGVDKEWPQLKKHIIVQEIKYSFDSLYLQKPPHDTTQDISLKMLEKLYLNTDMRHVDTVDLTVSCSCEKAVLLVLWCTCIRIPTSCSILLYTRMNLVYPGEAILITK
jgi:hypothetical protein